MAIPVNDNLKRFLNQRDGKYVPFAWPGGYLIVYITKDGGAVCCDCANGENGSMCYEATNDGNSDYYNDPQWSLLGAVLDEECDYSDRYCDHCGKALEPSRR